VPLAFAAVALRKWSPSATDTVRDHAPEAVAVVVPRETESTNKLTVEPASAVPDTATFDVESEL
jgi:hypothetical protein